MATAGRDRRGLVNVSLVLIMPKLANPWLERLLGAWNTSQIFTAATGSPFNETDGSDVSLSGVGADRPNVVGNPFRAGPVANNPTCNAPFVHRHREGVLQPLRIHGAASRNLPVTRGGMYCTAPATITSTSAIWRSFHIREKFTLDSSVAKPSIF